MRAATVVPSWTHWWVAAQAFGLAATAILLVALVNWPETALMILWNAVIPLVPASLLVSPALWRNVCPLASLNTLANGAIGKRQLRNGYTATTGMIGIALLALLVPARRFLFNADGAMLALTIGLVGLLAVALGAAFDLKAGFCNAICPVLPVERLYGQRPLLRIGNARCHPCTVCTQTGCIDLAPTKSIAQTLGPRRRTGGWLGTPFGLFSGAFPGFVIGYYTVADGPLEAALSVYGHVALWSAASLALVTAVVLARRMPAARVMPTLAALAAGLYYWFAPATVVPALGVDRAAVLPLRAVLLGLVLVWWVRTLWQPSRDEVGP